MPSHLQVITIGKKPAAWVRAGWQDYTKRLPRDFMVDLTEVSAASSKQFLGKAAIIAEEGKRLLEQTNKRHIVIALDSRGKPWETQRVAAYLQQWAPQRVQFLIGGPFGLSEACLLRANEIWSLSPATFSHPLARVVLAEQLYRAWCLQNNHPYHK